MRRTAVPARISRQDSAGDALRLPSICSIRSSKARPPGAVEAPSNCSVDHLRTIARQKGSKPSAASAFIHTSPRSGARLAPLDRFIPRYEAPTVHNCGHNQRSNNHEEEVVLKEIWLAATASAKVHGHTVAPSPTVSESSQCDNHAADVRRSEPVHTIDEEEPTVGTTTLARYRRLVGIQARKILLQIVRAAAENVVRSRLEDAAARTIHTAARRFLGRRRRARMEFEMTEAVERVQCVWRGWRGRKEAWRRREERRKRTGAVKMLQAWWTERRRREQEKRRNAEDKEKYEWRRQRDEESRCVARRTIGLWAVRRREVQKRAAREDLGMISTVRDELDVLGGTDGVVEEREKKAAAKEPQQSGLASVGLARSCEIETDLRDSSGAKRREYGAVTDVDADEPSNREAEAECTVLFAPKVERTEHAESCLVVSTAFESPGVENDVVAKSADMAAASDVVVCAGASHQTLSASLSAHAVSAPRDVDARISSVSVGESERGAVAKSSAFGAQLSRDFEVPVLDAFLSSTSRENLLQGQGDVAVTRPALPPRILDPLKLFFSTYCIPRARMIVARRQAAATCIQRLVRKQIAYKEVSFRRQLHLVSLRSELLAHWQLTETSQWTSTVGEDRGSTTAADRLEDERVLEGEDDALENWFDDDADFGNDSSHPLLWNELLPTRAGVFPHGIRLPFGQDRSMRTSDPVPNVGLWRWSWQAERWEPNESLFNLIQHPSTTE